MTENCPIHVLHVVPSMSLRAGMTSVVMNYHRAIDAEKVHFDYLYINPPDERIPEAESLGARVWRVPFAPRPSGFAAVRQFFPSMRASSILFTAIKYLHLRLSGVLRSDTAQNG